MSLHCPIQLLWRNRDTVDPEIRLLSVSFSFIDALRNELPFAESEVLSETPLLEISLILASTVQRV